MTEHEKRMKEALLEAEKAALLGEIPVGAVVVKDGEILAVGHNTRETEHDVTGHAELNAMKEAGKKLGRYVLSGCTLYVTLEPCVMCAGAAGWTQIGRIVYGASDPKRGFERLGRAMLHPKTVVENGLMKEECETLLKQFFQKKR